MENTPLETVPQKTSGSSIPPVTTEPSVCQSCHTPISAGANFWPQCGKKFTEGPESPRGNEPPVLPVPSRVEGSKVEGPLLTSIEKQAFIYIFSFLLAPLGLGYAVKYLKHWKDPRARQVGIVVIVLTVIAIAIMIWISDEFMQWEYQSINGLTGF